MSKKINMILFIVLIIFIAMPFFYIETGDKSYEYVGGVSLLPGFEFLEASGSHSAIVRSEYQSALYYLFVIIPIVEIALIGCSMYFEKSNGKKNISLLLEVLCYAVNFIGFVFAVFSLKESPVLPNYKFAFGYLGTIFIYVLIYAIKILDYLIIKTPPESELWPNTNANNVKPIKERRK